MASKKKIILDDDQKFILMKFRRSVMDILQPHHDDEFLLRWLKARSWNATAAEEMLRKSMKWREQWEVDGALKDWSPPKNIIPYVAYGHPGFDKEGAPVTIVRLGKLDIVGLLHCASRQDLIKYTVQVLEDYLVLAGKNDGHQMVPIFDMDGFNLSQYAWRPAAELVLELIQMYEDNYPEILKVCFIINAPRYFSIAFNVVKRFLNENTLSKIQIIKDPKKWKKAILDVIDPQNLPQCYGGALTDPDGNPRLVTRIKDGGKIPKSMYTKNLDFDDTKRYTSATIKNGQKLEIDFIVAEPGSYLRWDFRTEDHDIRFGVTCKDEHGDNHILVRHKRMAAHQMEESGVVTCQVPGTYMITFDNSYSILRNKKIRYFVRVVPPFDNIKKDACSKKDDEDEDDNIENIESNGDIVPQIANNTKC